MKQILWALPLLAVMSSCGSDEKKTTETSTDGATTTTTSTTQEPAKKTVDPEVDRGETLIAQNDCLGCHKIEEKLQGPGYREIAKKYAGQPGIEDTLAQHIIKGHVGTWGDVQMTAHPTLSEGDAKAMVKYILSLNQ